MAKFILDTKDFAKSITGWEEELREELYQELAISGRRIERNAKIKCPVDTGRLRTSITSEFNRNQLSAIIGTNVKYAPHVEFGTKKWSGKPFLRPAFEDELETFYKNVTAIITKGGS